MFAFNSDQSRPIHTANSHLFQIDSLLYKYLCFQRYNINFKIIIGMQLIYGEWTLGMVTIDRKCKSIE